MMPDELSGAVLAGGQSHRMGRDKALLVLDDEPLWLRQVRVLQQTGARVVGVVRQREQTSLMLPPGIRLWHDEVVGAGPLAGLHASLGACDTDWLAVLAVDMPHIDAAWFHRLSRLCKPGCGAMARSHIGHEPLAAIYPRVILPELRRRLQIGQHSLQSLADALIAAGQLISVQAPAAEFWRLANWNAPADVDSGRHPIPKP